MANIVENPNGPASLIMSEVGPRVDRGLKIISDYGNLVRQPYMAGRNYRVSGELVRTDRVMRDTFWIGVYPGLSEEMLEFACTRIEAFLGVGL